MNELDERHVIEALQALAGGLAVTDDDIIDAGARLQDRLEPRAPRRRLHLLVAGAAAALVLIGYVAVHSIDRSGNAAPPVHSPTHSPAKDLRAALADEPYALPVGRFLTGARPTYSQLAGLWLSRPPLNVAIFMEGNGDWRLFSPTGTGAFGTSRLAGKMLTKRLDDRSICARNLHLVGYSSPWQAVLAWDGSLRMMLMRDRSACSVTYDREVWDRTDPGSPIPSYLVAAEQDVEWQDAPQGFKWGEGVYLAPETGHVLEITGDGHYRYYDAVSVTLNAADRGELHSHGGKVSGSCAGGGFSGVLEVAKIPGVPAFVLPHDAIRITTSTTGCASGVADEEFWVPASLPS